ncbi:MAG: hypothetical protein ACOZQL_16105 [Myxococcota bacterium]
MRLPVLALVIVALPTFGAPRKKKAPPPPPPAPVVAPAPAPTPTPPAPSPPEPPPAPVVAPLPSAPAAAQPAELAADELVPLPPLRPATRFILSASGGVVAPFSVLGVGGRGELRLTWLTGAPLALSFSAGFEQHTARTAATFFPPQPLSPRGFDPAALDNQTLFPLQLLAHALLLRDEQNRVDVGAGYALLVAWTHAQALGTSAQESGVGHELALEAGYARRVGPIELSVRARYAVRRTAVGPLTATMELPWYQTAGVLVGLGLPL